MKNKRHTATSTRSPDLARKSEQELNRQQRVRDATRDALRMLNDALPAGEVCRQITDTYSLTPPTADNVMRHALARLIPEYGYLNTQIRTVAQRALQKLIAQSTTESIKLQAGRKLRRHFATYETIDRSKLPDVLKDLDSRPTHELATDRDRTEREMKLARSKLAVRRARRLSVRWERTIMKSHLNRKSGGGTTEKLKQMQEIMTLLAHPFRTAEIVDIMKRRHGLRVDFVEQMITECSKLVERDNNLHPVQVELINQRLAVRVLNGQEASDSEKLRAVDTLLESAPADASRDDADDAAAMQLRARYLGRDDLLPGELEQLLQDLWKDSKARWGWTRA